MLARIRAPGAAPAATDERRGTAARPRVRWGAARGDCAADADRQAPSAPVPSQPVATRVPVRARLLPSPAIMQGRRRFPVRTAFAAAAFAGALAGCGPATDSARTVALGECRLPRLATAAQCGTIDVPENRDKPDGRKISIAFAVLPANTLAPKADPLVLLPGGPGQSASALVPFAARLAEVRRTRDIVLVDPRGTGRSSPLDCAALKPDDKPDAVIEPDPVPKAKECLKELAERGVDAAQYTTAAWVADLEAVRAALGYPQWNLWGGSYGTRVALEYARRHPDRLRSMVLDGVAPPSLKVSLGVWLTREQALDALFKACAASPACAAVQPDLAATLARIRADLGPGGRDVRVANPRTGEIETHRLTDEIVVAGLHPLVYVPELAALIPAMLERASAGDFAPLYAAALLVGSDLADQMSGALHYSVTCAEDVPRIDDADRARLAATRIATFARQTLAVCDVWPRGRQPADATTPVVTGIPTLLVSGGLDPVTPPAYAEEVAKTLANHRHVVGTGYGHIVSPHACGPRLVAAFVDRAGFDTLPSSCVEHFAASLRPPLWPGRLAPAP
jgi:pimeloyl-ACP methyl ester carboxylesterase